MARRSRSPRPRRDALCRSANDRQATTRIRTARAGPAACARRWRTDRIARRPAPSRSATTRQARFRPKVPSPSRDGRSMSPSSPASDKSAYGARAGVAWPARAWPVPAWKSPDEVRTGPECRGGAPHVNRGNRPICRDQGRTEGWGNLPPRTGRSARIRPHGNTQLPYGFRLDGR